MSDGMGYIGLFLEAKRQKEQQQAQQQQQQGMLLKMQAKRAEMLDKAFQQAMQVAGTTGDEKGALGMLTVLGKDQDSQAHRDAVISRAKFTREQKQEKIARPDAGAQTDLARGVAAQMQAPGDPLRNTMGALQTLEGIDPVLANQIARRGGSLVGVDQARAKESDRRNVLRTDEWIRGKGGTAAGVKPPTASEVDRKADRENVAEAAWQKFKLSQADWADWVVESPPAVVAAAMRHPDYRKMRAKSKVRPAGAEASPEAAAPGPAAKKKTYPDGAVVEEIEE